MGDRSLVAGRLRETERLVERLRHLRGTVRVAQHPAQADQVPRTLWIVGGAERGSAAGQVLGGRRVAPRERA